MEGEGVDSRTVEEGSKGWERVEREASRPNDHDANSACLLARKLEWHQPMVFALLLVGNVELKATNPPRAQ